MKNLFAALLMITSSGVFAQQSPYEKDVKSIDSIIAALYDVISGDPGAARDWARFQYLFKPEARLIPTSKATTGEFGYRVITPDEYVKLFSSRISTGFFERELSRKTDEYGTIAQVFSTYETKEKKDGPVTNRGINSIQLFKDKDRYYIMNIFWCAESLGFVLPESYLK